MQRWKENQPAVSVTQLDILNLRYYTASGTVRGGTLLLRGVFQHFEIPSGAIKADRREYRVFSYFMLHFSDHPAGCLVLNRLIIWGRIFSPTALSHGFLY